MAKSFILIVLLSLSMTLFAQQYTSKILGKVTTVNNLDVLVTVDSAGTIILSTPGHSLYVDHRFAATFESTLEAILAGMRSVEAKDITLVDYRVIGKLSKEGWTHNSGGDGIMFHLEVNSNAKNKVLLLMYSTHDLEDMLFTSTTVSQLSALVNKALTSGVDYSDQYVFIQNVLDRIETSILR